MDIESANAEIPSIVAFIKIAKRLLRDGNSADSVPNTIDACIALFGFLCEQPYEKFLLHSENPESPGLLSVTEWLQANIEKHRKCILEVDSLAAALERALDRFEAATARNNARIALSKKPPAPAQPTPVAVADPVPAASTVSIPSTEEVAAEPEPAAVTAPAASFSEPAATEQAVDEAAVVPVVEAAATSKKQKPAARVRGANNSHKDKDPKDKDKAVV